MKSIARSSKRHVPLLLLILGGLIILWVSHPVQEGITSDSTASTSKNTSSSSKSPPKKDTSTNDASTKDASVQEKANDIDNFISNFLFILLFFACIVFLYVGFSGPR